MKILVCGGAGYIGSHMVRALLGAGHEVCVIDSLETGYAAALHKDARFHAGDLRNLEFVKGVFGAEKPGAVMDFAAYSLVGESVADPVKYYENNILGTVNLIRAMNASGVRHMVFSSTASVYGIPKSVPITLGAETNPINPYGESKLAVEKLLARSDAAYGLKSACLRYFNVAGAHESGEIGEDHRPETHLIPVLLLSIIKGNKFKIFGSDYNTPDGTCVRDYIDVNDLCGAHLLALDKIIRDDASVIYNLGSESGYSNLEILRAVEKVTGRPVDYEIAGRRPGDPDVLIASSEQITADLGWRPRRGLESMIESAYRWHRNHPKGYN